MKKKTIALLLITVVLCLFGFAYAESNSEYGFGVRHKIETEDGVFYITIEDVRLLYGDWSLIAKNKSEDTVFISVHAIVENESVKELYAYKVSECMDIVDEDGFSLEFYNVDGMEDGKYEVCPSIKAGAKKRGSYPYFATRNKNGFTIKFADGSEFRIKVRQFDRTIVYPSLPASSPIPTPGPTPALGSTSGTSVISDSTSQSSIASGSVQGSASEITKQLIKSAEDFSLHSGVRFGMSRDKVELVEIAKGFSVSKTLMEYTYYDKNGKYVGRKADALIVQGSMAGIPSSLLYYYFDEKDKLFAAVYEFGKHSISSYDEIQQLVFDKYAERKTDKSFRIAMIIDTFYNSRNDGIYGFKTIQIENNDNTVISINHALLYPKLDGYSVEVNCEFGGRHYLEYRIATIDEIEESDKAVDQKNQREEEARQKEEEEKNRQRLDDI